MYYTLTPTVAQLVIAAGVVWSINGLTSQVLSGWPNVGVVILLSIPVWVLTNWVLTRTGILPEE